MLPVEIWIHMAYAHVFHVDRQDCLKCSSTPVANLVPSKTKTLKSLGSAPWRGTVAAICCKALNFLSTGLSPLSPGQAVVERPHGFPSAGPRSTTSQPSQPSSGSASSRKICQKPSVSQLSQPRSLSVVCQWFPVADVPTEHVKRQAYVQLLNLIDRCRQTNLPHPRGLKSEDTKDENCLSCSGLLKVFQSKNSSIYSCR